MNRYESTFTQLREKNDLGFCPFAVLNSPSQESCIERVRQYCQKGATMLELGVPFSDPVADGPVVAKAVEEALANGSTTRLCFETIKKIREFTQAPIGLLCYANSVYCYGITRFFESCREAGADSVLIADLPLEEIKPYNDAAKKARVKLVYIVSEKTTLARLKEIEKINPAFLYVVSTLGVTGARKELPPQLFTTLEFLRKNTDLPTAVGFGISRPEHFEQLHGKTNAAIVGSYLVSAPHGEELGGKLTTLMSR